MARRSQIERIQRQLEVEVDRMLALLNRAAVAMRAATNGDGFKQVTPKLTESERMLVANGMVNAMVDAYPEQEQLIREAGVEGMLLQAMVYGIAVGREIAKLERRGRRGR